MPVGPHGGKCSAGGCVYLTISALPSVPAQAGSEQNWDIRWHRRGTSRDAWVRLLRRSVSHCRVRPTLPHPPTSTRLAMVASHCQSAPVSRRCHTHHKAQTLMPAFRTFSPVVFPVGDRAALVQPRPSLHCSPTLPSPHPPPNAPSSSRSLVQLLCVTLPAGNADRKALVCSVAQGESAIGGD